MKCLRCGKESPNDVKFCPDCGYQFIQPQNGNIPQQGEYKTQGSYQNMGPQSVPYHNTGNVQQPKKKHGCLTAILICIGAVIGIFILGVLLNSCGGGDNETSSKKTNSSYELYELRDAREDEVCKYFGVEKDETGSYPSDDSILVYCVNEKVFMLHLSKNAPKYKLCGIKIGDSADSAKEAIKNNFTEKYTQEISEATRICYSDNKYEGYILFIDVDSNNKIVGAGYGPEDDAEYGYVEDDEEIDDSPKSEKKEFDSEELKYISKCENIPYDDLARKPDEYTGKNIMFYGQVTQVLQEDNMYQYQVYTGGHNNEDGFVFYELPDGADRILENDMVCVFASYEGLMTYETTNGDERTVPKYSAYKIENINNLPLAGSKFDGLYGEYASEDGGRIAVGTEGEDVTIDVTEDGKSVIQTYAAFVLESSDSIICVNANDELDAVLTVDSENKEINVIAGLDSKYSSTFKLDKASSKKNDDKENEKETEEESSGSELVDEAVAILERATKDALDDGDIVYMTAVDMAKANGGTYVLDFDMTIFTDPYRDNFEDQLVGKINDTERVTLDYALKEADIKINLNQDGTFSVTKTLFSDSSSGSSGYSEYYFEDSDSRYLTEDDLSGLSKDDLAYARNEIYARHGYIFQDQMFVKYFNSRTWYVPKYSGAEFDDSVFNEYERKNIEFIKNHE